MYTGQFVYCGRKATLVVGNVLPLRSIPEGAVVCNVEHHVGDRGVFARCSGDYTVVISHNPDNDTTRYCLSLVLLLKVIAFFLVYLVFGLIVFVFLFLLKSF